MEQSITIKAKLLNIDDETAQVFAQSMEKYKDACNFISHKDETRILTNWFLTRTATCVEPWRYKAEMRIWTSW